MRRSAWTTGAAILAALSLGVAACGGSDSGSDVDKGGTDTGDDAAEEREDGWQADGPLDRRC